MIRRLRRFGSLLLLTALALPAFAKSGNAPLTPMVRIVPTYPAAAEMYGYGGVVNVCFTVLTNGKVGNVRVGDFKLTAPSPANAPPSATAVEQARKLLGDAAVAAVQQDRFFPAKREGKPVETKNVCERYAFKAPRPTAHPPALTAPAVAGTESRPVSPMLRMTVPYPSDARRKGYEGVVTLCFTVLKDGDTADVHLADFKLTASEPANAPPSATKVTEARDLLGGAVLSVFPNYKFFPRMIDGKAVATKNVCEKFNFTRHHAPTPSTITTPPPPSSQY